MIGLILLDEEGLVKKNYSVAFIFLSFVFIACSTNYDTKKDIYRAPSSIKMFSFRAPASSEELGDRVDDVYKFISDKNSFRADSCSGHIDGITDFLMLRGSEKFIPKTEEEKKVFEKEGLGLVKKIMAIRLKLKERHQEFYEDKSLNEAPDCTSSVRKAMRYARFMEEFIVEWLYGRKVYTDGVIKLDHAKTNLQYFARPGFEDFTFKSGDVLVVRAASFVSATIARIGDEDGQLSHGALVYVDESGLNGPKGKVYVMEALITDGVLITPIEEWQKSGHARSLVFRYKDEVVAKKAAQSMFDFIKKSNKKINYDFRMDMSSYNELFCTEVIKFGYDKATNGKLILPTFKTQVDTFQENSEFLTEMGIAGDFLFAPSDMELEPDFNLILEWRDPGTSAKVRIQDGILSKMLKLMEDDGYKLSFEDAGLMVNLKGVIANAMRHFGIKMPSNMTEGFLKHFILLELVTKKIEAHMFPVEDRQYLQTGFSMNYSDILEELESYRKDDCKNYEKFKAAMGSDENSAEVKVDFHTMFNSGSGCI